MQLPISEYMQFLAVSKLVHITDQIFALDTGYLSLAHPFGVNL